jgi:flagellar hook-associated protein 1 FlgK
MVLQVENYRESISGVSIDEETVNLIKYQNAYQAAAKLINTADEMMETILSMI